MEGSSRQGWAVPQGHTRGAGIEAQAGEAGSRKECGQRRKMPVLQASRPLAHPDGQSQACGPLRAQDNPDASPIPDCHHH